MPEDSNQDEGRNGRRGGQIRVPPRTWLLWLAILSLIPLLVFFKGQSESKYKILSHHEFLQLVDSNAITEATIHYDPQSPVREVTGKYQESPTKPLMPFKLKTWLSEALEDQLLKRGQFKVAVPNMVLLNLLYGMFPILLLGALVYFFLIRPINLMHNA